MKRKEKDNKIVLMYIMIVILLVVIVVLIDLVALSFKKASKSLEESEDNIDAFTSTVTSSSISSSSFINEERNNQQDFSDLKESLEKVLDISSNNFSSKEIKEETEVKVDNEIDVINSYDVKSYYSNFYAYMSCWLFADWSDQYALQQNCWTDSYGLRRYGNDICIALGSRFGSVIGTRYQITLSNGYSFTAILADVKADCDTDVTNTFRYAGDGTPNIIEVLVDPSYLNYDVLVTGDVGALPEFNHSYVSYISEIS